MDEKPKRRWFRLAFSLRTMFVIVTIFGVWLGWQLKVVHERKAVLAEIERIDPAYSLRIQKSNSRMINFDACRHAKISRVRRMLGDDTVYYMSLPPSLDRQLIERAEYAFPEAIMAVDADDESRYAFRDSLFKPPRHRSVNTGTIFKTGLIEN